MGMPGRTGDHQWSQQHLSHYVEGELRPRARRRLDRHARSCVECGRGIRAMRALVYAVQGLDGLAGVRAELLRHLGNRLRVRAYLDAYPQVAEMVQARFGYVIPGPAPREGGDQ